MGNINDKINNVLFTLAQGMKDADNIILSQTGDSDADKIGIHQTVEEQRISKDLLKGEITQPVKEMRHRIYNVSKEANDYEYLGNGVAVKKREFKKLFIEESDGNEVWIIQDNEPIVNNVLDELERVGRTGDYVQYIIKIERDYLSRFRLEEYTTKLVVKKVDGDKVILDFYCSIYPNKFDIKSKPFVTELKKIKENRVKSDIIDFNGVWFITQKAYGSEDLLKYSFNNISFKEILEFDGNYVLRFNATVNINGEDLTKQYYDEIMANKYNTHEKKNVEISLNGAKVGNVSFENADEPIKTCECCGRKIDSYDANLTKFEFGESLCKDCLKKKLENA